MSAEQGNVQPWRENVERVREFVRSPWGLQERTLKDLDALTTKIEELEHDAIDVEADRRYQQDRARAAEKRVEELERERDAANTYYEAAKEVATDLRIERDATEARAEKAERALAVTLKLLPSYERRKYDAALLLSEEASDA